MHARSAVVDLYGDHLSSRGWWAPVSTVIMLSRTVQVQPAATRTAISRLVAQGWLEPAHRDGSRGYAATPAARERWTHAHTRIYADGPAAWDGRWHLVHVGSGGERRRRDQVATTLAYLGYGRLGGSVWVSPRQSPELAVSLEGLEAPWVAVHGPLDGGQNPAEIAAAVWDLDQLRDDYEQFSARVESEQPSPTPSPAQAYADRTRLVHEWRRFLFRDPDLPAAVLPPDWPGHEARRRFLATAGLLAPAAGRFVEEALGAAGSPAATGTGGLAAGR